MLVKWRMSSSADDFSKNFPTNCVPLLVSRYFLMPHGRTQFSSCASVTAAAVVVRMKTSWEILEKGSVITRTEVLTFFDLGRGPNRSVATLSSGPAAAENSFNCF